jgi:hypothetical protein
MREPNIFLSRFGPQAGRAIFNRFLKKIKIKKPSAV